MPLLLIAPAALPRPAENFLGQIVGFIRSPYDAQQIPADRGAMLADPFGHAFRFR